MQMLVVISTGKHIFQHEDLEKSWLSWSGAREVYKHSPRSWTLQRIALHKLPELKYQLPVFYSRTNLNTVNKNFENGIILKPFHLLFTNNNLHMKFEKLESD